MDKSAGYTLIELLIVIALVVVLAAIAVPSYFHMVANNSVTGAVNALAATLSQARSEAITRGEKVVVCPSADVTVAKPVCDENGGWQEGWFVFVDENDNHTLDSNEDLLRVHGPVGSGVSMSGSSGGGDVAPYIGFNRMGFAQPTFGGGITSLTVVACPPDKKAANARGLILNRSGAISTAARQSNGSTFSCS